MNKKALKDIKVFLIHLCIIISQIIYLETLYKFRDDEKIQNEGGHIYSLNPALPKLSDWNEGRKCSKYSLWSSTFLS